MNSCHHVTRYETFQIRHKFFTWLRARKQKTDNNQRRRFGFHIAPTWENSVYMRFSSHFHAGMTFHASMRRRHEIFMSPRNESFISPRHHVNTTLAQTSTRYENSCRHETSRRYEFHVGLMASKNSNPYCPKIMAISKIMKTRSLVKQHRFLQGKSLKR